MNESQGGIIFKIMDAIEQAILARIKEAIEGQQLTQAELARRMGLPQYRLNRLLNGHPFPRLSELQRFGETLNLSLPYLLGISEKGQSDLTPRQKEVLSRYQAIDTGTRLIVDKILDIKSSK